MHPQVAEVWKYLSAPAGSLWKWSDDGQVAVWKHSGGTIAFREELVAVLERLAARGLPSLDAILLLIASTREGWAEDSRQLQQLVMQPVDEYQTRPCVIINGQVLHIPDVLAKLDRISKLPRSLVESLEAKVQLASFVLETAWSPGKVTLQPELARMVCEALDQGLLREHNQVLSLPKLSGGRVQTSRSLRDDLFQLAFGLEGLTEETLRTWLATGLEDLPNAAPLELPADPEAVRGLMLELASDQELGGVIRLARNLSAVVPWPRSLSDSDEMPLGGVSDITNRGPLDRLLLSELAHDDLMLSTRIALNEALFLRREAPPSDPLHRRMVLIDVGLRLWGLPRVYATGVALSLAMAGGRNQTMVAFQPRGTDVAPVDITSRAGLIAHLESLEPTAHPGLAMTPFFERVVAESSPGEVVFITTPSVLADPDFQRMWRDVMDDSRWVGNLLIATVQRSGEFQLWSQSQRGRKLLSQLRLDLDELLKPPVQTASKPSKKLLQKALDPDLPAIFRRELFPLRMPNLSEHSKWSVRHKVPEREMIPTPGPGGSPDFVLGDTVPSSKVAYGVLALTRDRRLLYFNRPHSGGIQIAEGVSHGECLWSMGNEQATLSRALIYRGGDPSLTLLTVDLHAMRLDSTVPLQTGRQIARSKIIAVASHNGVLFLILEKTVEVYAFETGKLLCQDGIPANYRWLNDRFFDEVGIRGPNTFRAMSYDLANIRFDTVNTESKHHNGAIYTFFDRRGRDGPFGVHIVGTIVNLAEDTQWEWTEQPRSYPKVIDIDDDGRRILLELNSATRSGYRQRIVIDVDAQKVEQVESDRPSTETAQYQYWSYSKLAAWDAARLGAGGIYKSLPHHFTRIIADPMHGALILVSKRGVPWRLDLKSGPHSSGHPTENIVMTQMKSEDIRDSTVLKRSFESTMHPNPGCKLSVATWDDGSRAFVDSRGLLHLQSGDRSIPEATLVLNDSAVSGWTSDDRQFGIPYFLTIESSTMLPSEFFETILKPFLERLR